MTPSRFHAAVGVTGALLASAIVRGAAPVVSLRFNRFVDQKTSDRPSGDHEGKLPPSVPWSGRAIVESSDRSHSRDVVVDSPPGPEANTMWRPSGEGA